MHSKTLEAFKLVNSSDNSKGYLRLKIVTKDKDTPYECILPYTEHTADSLPGWHKVPDDEALDKCLSKPQEKATSTSTLGG